MKSVAWKVVRVLVTIVGVTVAGLVVGGLIFAIAFILAGKR